MPSSFKFFGLILTAGAMSLTLGSASPTSARELTNVPPIKIAGKPYPYSSTLISRYNAGCTPKLQERGRTVDQAKQVCQCSINQMQQQHSQTDAISLLIKAQFSSSTDPKTGLPIALSKYFTPCMS